MASESISKIGVRIVVAGEAETGKSCLIFAAAKNEFRKDIRRVLPPTTFAGHDGLHATIIDTSSCGSLNDVNLVDELKKADAVVLTYACDQHSTLDRLATKWLPLLRQLQVNVPVFVAGCKVDLMGIEYQHRFKIDMTRIMEDFPEIDTCVLCSAYQNFQIREIFTFTQKTVLYPIAPIFDQDASSLRPVCIKALKRVFILCDHDRDGRLNETELNYYQDKCCFDKLKPSDLDSLKDNVQEKLDGGFNEQGLSFDGFLLIHLGYIENGCLQSVWDVLRTFGYRNDLTLGDDQLVPLIHRTPDQSVELTSSGVEFLTRVFSLFDADHDGVLTDEQLEDIFYTAPKSPWSEAPYANAEIIGTTRGLSLDGFLSKWALMTRLDPIHSAKNLLYIGYTGELSAAVRVSRRRAVDRKKQQSDRNVFQCFVFGPKEAGKSSLLYNLVERQYLDLYAPTTNELFAVNTVGTGATKKTLIMREITQDSVEKMLLHKDALADCDVAVFVNDSSNEASWIRAKELLVQVASHGESSLYEVPCLIVAAKGDLAPFPEAIEEFAKVSQDMGVMDPILVSSKSRYMDNIYEKIVGAAERPHLSVPETEAGKSRKRNRRIVKHSLVFISAAVVIALVANRVNAARKGAI